MGRENISRAADLLERGDYGEALSLLNEEISGVHPRGWMARRFRIALEKGWCEVDGMCWNPHNLGIHIWSNNSVAVDVTHIPTGKRLASFASLGAAMNFVESIDDLFDWNQPTLANLPPDMERLVRGSARVHQEESFPPRPLKETQR